MYSIKTAPKKVLLSSLHILMTELSNDDGSENVAKKCICVLSNFIAYIWIRSICRMEAMFLELNSHGLYPGSQREREIPRFMCTSCIKRHIGEFHVVVVQWTSKEYAKSMMHVQSCCFAHKTNCLLTLSSSSWSR